MSIIEAASGVPFKKIRQLIKPTTVHGELGCSICSCWVKALVFDPGPHKLKFGNIEINFLLLKPPSGHSLAGFVDGARQDRGNGTHRTGAVRRFFKRNTLIPCLERAMWAVRCPEIAGVQSLESTHLAYPDWLGKLLSLLAMAFAQTYHADRTLSQNSSRFL